MLVGTNISTSDKMRRTHFVHRQAVSLDGQAAGSQAGNRMQNVFYSALSYRLLFLPLLPSSMHCPPSNSNWRLPMVARLLRLALSLLTLNMLDTSVRDLGLGASREGTPANVWSALL